MQNPLGLGKFSLHGPRELLVPPHVSFRAAPEEEPARAAVALRVFGLPATGYCLGPWEASPGAPASNLSPGFGVELGTTTARNIRMRLCRHRKFFGSHPAHRGGSDKMSDFSTLSGRQSAEGDHAVGRSGTDRIVPLLERTAHCLRRPFHSMGEAVDAADRAAEEGDIVLLSRDVRVSACSCTSSSARCLQKRSRTAAAQRRLEY